MWFVLSGGLLLTGLVASDACRFLGLLGMTLIGFVAVTAPQEREQRTEVAIVGYSVPQAVQKQASNVRVWWPPDSPKLVQHAEFALFFFYSYSVMIFFLDLDFTIFTIFCISRYKDDTVKRPNDPWNAE